ncbi:MAG: deoxyribose-phosphate aldolase [Chloroflexota bacterium]|nr:deoxyribose-phosphate aldolase [Chloroflexota bacterium]
MSTSGDPGEVGVWTPTTVAARIQHTLLRQDATQEEVEQHCRECLEFGFDAAMIAGNWLPVGRRILAGSSVKIASAVDFPSGIMTTAGKAAEARALVEGGAGELDIMVNVGWLRSGLDVEFRDDIARVVQAARPAIVKVMLELPLLTEAERDRAVDLAVDAGVGFVKNASSSAVGVATPDEIRYLRDRAPGSVGVKASGGIKSWQHAVELFDAGADLVGSSAGVAIVLREAGAVSY